jgi:GUN4-like/NACHT domain
MPDEPASYSSANIEKVFELLDSRLVSLGVPGALCAIGFSKVYDNAGSEVWWYFVGAAGIWLTIKVGKKLAPKIDQLLDWVIANVERSLIEGWSKLHTDFEGQYLKQQARLCEEFTTEGFNPDRTTIPLLEEVFVPLELSGAVSLGEISKKNSLPWAKHNFVLTSEHLNIWNLLARSRRDRQFRQMSIQAKGGMGKTTLLRHVALIYAQKRYSYYGAPKLIPILLKLRDLTEPLTRGRPPSLSQLITETHVPNLSKSRSLKPPSQWAEYLLSNGNALVMFDGFDELPESKRKQVSRWISAQMREYGQSVFIITSRPAGFRDYVAQRPAVPIFVNKFSLTQQKRFIHRWYFCQERCCRSEKQINHAKTVAKERADDLINQLQQRREELGYMAENPLLLNMLATFHRFDLSVELPRQRVDLYRGICKLQLDDRPKARMIRMHLPFEKSQVILQTLALAMVRKKQFQIGQQELLNFLGQQSVFQENEIEPEVWLKQILEVSELLVERETGEYEFPHLSFQGFFSAAQLAQAQSVEGIQTNAQLVLRNWTDVTWRETVLLYTAQLNPKQLESVILKACEQGSEAAELAAVCLREYPRPETFRPDLTPLLQKLGFVAQHSKYQTLENLLREHQWREADEETYRLMITTVGKEEGQSFNRSDLENISQSELHILDQLWLKYSKDKWGFSTQKRIWQEFLRPSDYNHEKWEQFGERVGWRKDSTWVTHVETDSTRENSIPGTFPFLIFQFLVPAKGIYGFLLSRVDVDKRFELL